MTHFFDLPLEIRHEIYSFVFTWKRAYFDLKRLTPDSPCTFQIEEDATSSTQRGLLLSSKRNFTDAISSFYDNTNIDIFVAGGIDWNGKKDIRSNLLSRVKHLSIRTSSNKMCQLVQLINAPNLQKVTFRIDNDRDFDCVYHMAPFPSFSSGSEIVPEKWIQMQDAAQKVIEQSDLYKELDVRGEVSQRFSGTKKIRIFVYLYPSENMRSRHIYRSLTATVGPHFQTRILDY